MRAKGIRMYKHTMSCVVSNELMCASQGYPIHLNQIRTWCGRRESNPRLQLGKLTCCHYTTPAIVKILYYYTVNVQNKTIDDGCHSHDTCFCVPDQFSGIFDIILRVCGFLQFRVLCVSGCYDFYDASLPELLCIL